MKFKVIKLLSIIFTLALCFSLLTACGGENCEHDFSILKNDALNHWYECFCGEKYNIEAHNGGKATCSKKAVCETCSISYGELSTTHKYSNLKHDALNHWYECACGDKSGVEEHKGGEANCFNKAVCEDCKSVYGEFKHNYQTEITEPTCVEMGYTTFTCDCGDTYVGDYVDAYYHDYSDWTLSPEGALYKVCSRDSTHKFYKKADDDFAVLYSYEDKALDLPSLKKALSEQGVNITSLKQIQCYIVNGKSTSFLDLDVIISNTSSGFVDNYGRERTVAIPQTVTVIINGKEYKLDSVYAYTKIIDEAIDLKYFTMNGVRKYNEIDGYFIVTKNIDASALELDSHVFYSNKIYPGNSYNSDIGFRGVFDGQGHTINGLTVKSCGLFGQGNSPVIKNIAFTNVNLTGYYPTLFAISLSRGKYYNNSFNGYEGLFSNIYVSINSTEKGGASRIGLLVNQVLPTATKMNNVVVEYSNVSDDIKEFISAGNNFYMFGSSTFSMANSIETYNDCYAISTAPVLSSNKMPGFAQNQVEFTLGEAEYGYKVDSVGKILDEQVNKVLDYHDITLTPEHVIVGLRAYADRSAMSNYKQANADSLATFDSKYWVITNGVPVWKSL